MSDALELLPPTAAAARLGVKPATLAKWRVKGGGPAFRKIGTLVLYPVAELAAWVQAQPLRSSTSEAVALPVAQATRVTRRAA